MSSPVAHAGRIDAEGQPDEVRPIEREERRWRDVLVRTAKEVKQDRVPMMSAAAAFYSLLALVPTLVAVVSIYGLAADPNEVDQQVGGWLDAAPREVRDLVASQLQSIASNTGAEVGVGLAVGIAVALFSASNGMNHLMQAINVAYDETETRSWLRRRLVALALTAGGMAFLLLAVVVIAFVPAILADTGLGAEGRIAGDIARWIVLLLGMMFALTVLYRFAPDRDEPRWAWTSPGAVVATLLWLIASVGFSIYAANFAKYNETYGSLGAIVITMLWLFITALAVIVGAELNAEFERPSSDGAVETTPMGDGSVSFS
ncbi:MAG: ribonuclease [Ilumatobacteraceae bacterium]|nr:ribonuclease [Ilumatobacteraceae bacterium]